ncbi:MAG TPA: hypothetical protein DER56_01950 [Thermosipho africanus]|nr:hypothetical protein [Thermosipho africanus]
MKNLKQLVEEDIKDSKEAGFTHVANKQSENILTIERYYNSIAKEAAELFENGNDYRDTVEDLYEFMRDEDRDFNFGNIVDGEFVEHDESKGM